MKNFKKENQTKTQSNPEWDESEMLLAVLSYAALPKPSDHRTLPWTCCLTFETIVYYDSPTLMTTGR